MGNREKGRQENQKHEHKNYFRTNAKIANWDTAHGWGDHSTGGYSASSHNHDSSYAAVNADTNGTAGGLSGTPSISVADLNTSGVSTAFTPTGNATLFMSNKVSVISPNPTAASVVYIQQVQTTGSA